WCRSVAPAGRVQANRGQWRAPAGSGSSHRKVSMSRIPGEVLKRALAAVASGLVALTVLAVVARPATAGERGGDPLPDTAAQTLTDLRGVRVAQVAAALAGGALDPAAAVATYQADLGQLAGIVAERTATPADAFAAVWAATDSTRMTVLLSALEQAG